MLGSVSSEAEVESKAAGAASLPSCSRRATCVKVKEGVVQLEVSIPGLSGR